MAKVQCEYCGHYIEDTLEVCDNCGAVNSNHQRTTADTPQTIEQLKSWYKARNLPPEETTRFFIGKDIKEPCAFGIYKEGNEFIVYKNKSNGQRAVRYKGTDEAYAVNELYMRLKEEILNQKNINIKKKTNANHTNSYKYNSNNSSRYSINIFRNLIRNVRLLAVCFFAFTLIYSFIQSPVNFIFDTLLSSNYNIDNIYYLTDTNEIYYRAEGTSSESYELWKFNPISNQWEFYATYNIFEKNDITNADKNTIKSFSSFELLKNELSSDVNVIDITKQKSFIDAGHKKTPVTSYYTYNNELYYFLDDIHGSYGKDNTGWYVFRNNAWIYLCDVDDKDTIGEDLWYSDYDYQIASPFTNAENSDDVYLNQWNATNFEDTDWYSSYKGNNKAYENDIANDYDNDDDYDWSSDNDYDWDSDDSWDSGGSDWDSDW